MSSNRDGFLWPPSGSLVSCWVESSFLPHLLVVSLELPGAGATAAPRRYQGALLEVSKSNCHKPFFTLDKAFHNQLQMDNPGDYRTGDASANLVATRHTYFTTGKENVFPPRFMPSPNQTHCAKPGRRGVRHRARHVLCQRCESVCADGGDQVTGQRVRISLDCIKKMQRSSLVPVIKRLDPKEILRLSANAKTKRCNPMRSRASGPFSHSSGCHSKSLDTEGGKKGKVEERRLRKRQKVPAKFKEGLINTC